MKKLFVALLPFFFYSCLYVKQEEIKVPISSEVSDSLRMEIKSYSMNNDSIPKNYFNYFGFRDWYRWPLVYPYSLNCIDMRDDGYICDESEAEDISYSSDGVEQLGLHGIKELSFNENVLIVKTEGFGSTTATFELFNFKNKSISTFPSEAELIKKARKSGQLISDSLLTIEEYNLIFD